MQTPLNPWNKMQWKESTGAEAGDHDTLESCLRKEIHVTRRRGEMDWNTFSFILWYIILLWQERGLSKRIEGSKKRRWGKRYNGQRKGCINRPASQTPHSWGRHIPLRVKHKSLKTSLSMSMGPNKYYLLTNRDGVPHDANCRSGGTVSRLSGIWRINEAPIDR